MDSQTRTGKVVGGNAAAPPGATRRIDLKRRVHPIGASIHGLLFLCGAISITTTLGIVFILGRESLLFFGTDEVSVGEFLTGRSWIPPIGEFGILPLLTATFVTSMIAMLVAIPLGLSAAIYLSEYAAPGVRRVFKPVLEILAGIPTVVYGYFAITFVTPLLRAALGIDVIPGIYNMASPGLVMGIMIVPIVSSMSEDALSAVPHDLRAGALAIGATKLETTLRVVMPAALSGIVAAFIVGISRAIGETMIVAIAAGARPTLTLNPFIAAETMTGYIARISGGDVSYNSLDYNSIFAVGLALFVLTFTLNIVSSSVVRRFREVYE